MGDYSLIFTFLASAGALMLSHELIKVILFAYERVVSSGTAPKSYGQWAVVTGATDGIGKAVAIELAKKGMNLILISRTQSKLDTVKKEIGERNLEVEVDTLAVDYSTFTVQSPGYEKVKQALEKRKEGLGILVNNVGMSYSFPKYFHELDEAEVSTIISLNIISTTLMTKLFLPHLLAKTRSSASTNQPKGCIVNLGSFAGIMASPLLAEYSAAKAYVERFTQSLSLEYDKEGVEFQCHVPLYIVSKMSKMKKETAMVPSAEAYAKAVVANLGKQVIVSGHLLQSVATYFVQRLPRKLFLKQVRSMHQKIRVKGFRKLEREKQSN